MQEISNVEIGKRIKMAREEKGLTKRELAERIHIHESNVGRYENGEVKGIKLPIIQAMANVLGVSPMWLAGKTDDKNYNSTEYVLEDAYFNFAKELQEKKVSKEDMDKLWQFYDMIKKM